MLKIWKMWPVQRKSVTVRHHLRQHVNLLLSANNWITLRRQAAAPLIWVLYYPYKGLSKAKQKYEDHPAASNTQPASHV